MIPTFVINLDLDRRTVMEARLGALKIPYAIFKGTDGRVLTPDELKRAAVRQNMTYPISLMPNLVANGLSHMAAIAEGARLDCDFFCVFEDDILLAPQLPACLERDALAGLPEFDVLRLFTHIDRWDKPSKIVAYFHGSIVVRMLRPGWGAQGQIYSRKGARKILAKMTSICGPFDEELYHACRVSGLRVLELRPGMVDRDNAMVSTIGPRPPLSRENETLLQRLDRTTSRLRQKFVAAISFFRAWGVKEFFSFFSAWR